MEIFFFCSKYRSNRYRSKQLKSMFLKNKKKLTRITPLWSKLGSLGLNYTRDRDTRLRVHNSVMDDVFTGLSVYYDPHYTSIY